MSKLNDLIKELCPNGVEHKKLGDVCTVATGDQLNKSLLTDNGEYPVYNGGMAPSGYWNDYNAESDTIIISQGGASAGYVNFVATNFWAGAHCYIVKPSSLIENKYLYYLLKNMQAVIQGSKIGAGIPGLNRQEILKLEVPLPPLKIQQEIVKILDKFTELQAELQAELDLRLKQYEHYRDELLQHDESSAIVKISDVSTVERGKRVTKENLAGCSLYNVYQNSLTPLGKYNDYNCPENTTYMIAAGAAGEIGFSEEKFWAADDCYFFTCSELLSSRYLYHVLCNKRQQIASLVRRASIPRISRSDIENLKMSLPSLDIQKRVVNVLDNFESICADLNIGLPAEINLRQQQYEYYRDALLTYAETGHIISQTNKQTNRQTDTN